MMMQTRIQHKLDEIEQQHEVRILLAVESGSRAWGFASPDSDYDVRFIYVHNVRDYIRLNPPRDVIELPIQSDLDVNGWDLVKALGLFRKSNPPLLEWLHSPIIYRECGPFASKMRDLAQTHYSARRMALHYLSMAKQNYLGGIEGREAVSLKKYLYVLRPLIAARWIHEQEGPPPTSIHACLEGVRLPSDVRDRLMDLLDRKQRCNELGSGPPEPVLNEFITAELEAASANLLTLPDPNMDVSLLNLLIWETVGI